MEQYTKIIGKMGCRLQVARAALGGVGFLDCEILLMVAVMMPVFLSSLLFFFGVPVSLFAFWFGAGEN